MEPAYLYRATLNRRIDGDTYVLNIDLGFHITAAQTIRLCGYDTPERGHPNWKEAGDFAEEKLKAGPIIVETYKDKQSFARWVADVYVDGRHLGELLLDAGLANILDRK